MYCQVFSHISELSPLEVNSVPLTNFDNPKRLQLLPQVSWEKGIRIIRVGGTALIRLIDKTFSFYF